MIKHSMDSILIIIFLLGLRAMLDRMAEISRVAQAQEDWVELCQRAGFQFLKPWPGQGYLKSLPDMQHLSPLLRCLESLCLWPRNPGFQQAR